jgi:hypothetical protein
MSMVRSTRTRFRQLFSIICTVSQLTGDSRFCAAVAYLKITRSRQRKAYIVEDDEFERFCRDNLNYLIFMVGGRVAPRERILFLKQFVIAADMPDDHTARSHRREREAYAELTDSEDDLD